MSKPYCSINTKHRFRFFCFLAGAGSTLILLAMMPASYAFADGPTITGATDITVEATSTNGAMVTFSVAATDPVDGIIFPICTPPSGNLFALGTTTVTCTVTNSVASTTQATFGVGVVDTIPPYITPPADQTFLSTGILTDPAGLVLATSTDAVDYNPSITYFPTSFVIGTTTVIWTATDAADNMSTTTSDVGIVEAVTITIRDGATVAFSGTVALPASNAVPVDIAPTSTSSTVAVPARSLLSILETLDTAQNEFTITDLQYYSDWDSFYINCITITAKTDPLCGSWQYVVNGVAPPVGVDKALLKNGDIVFLYFGSPQQVSLSTTAATVGIPFTATAQKYDPMNNAYVATTDVTIGITQPDPDNLWNPIEVATSTVDVNGQTIFTLNVAGTYGVGIKEDYYFPLTTLTVTDPITNPISSSGGGGGGDSSQSTQNIDIARAIAFLAANQNSDGSIGSSILYSDWSALAFAAYGGESAAMQKLKDFLANAQYDTDFGSRTTDWERRAMALMALGINPYNGTQIDFIGKIVSAFDGNQIGDPQIFNDDIFALFPLLKASYSGSDEIIKKTSSFILSKQEANGGWGGVDLTAAAIQGLSLVLQNPGNLENQISDSISNALARGKTYLQNSQNDDGSFGGNTIATAWASQAIAALNEPVSSWQRNGRSALDFMASRQKSDGGFEENTLGLNIRIWTTAYIIPAALNKTWGGILKNFSRPTQEPIINNISLISPAGTSTVPESVATSTAEVSFLPEQSEPNATSSPVIENQNLSAERIILETSGQNIPNETVQKEIIPADESNGKNPAEILTSAQDLSSGDKAAVSPDAQPLLIAAASNSSAETAKIIFISSTIGALILGIYLGLKILFLLGIF